MSESDEKGRPKQTPPPDGLPTYPGNQGGTNWYSRPYSQRTGLFPTQPAQGPTTRHPCWRGGVMQRRPNVNGSLTRDTRAFSISV